MSCNNSHLFIQIYHHTYQVPCFYMLFSFFLFLNFITLAVFLKADYKTGSLSTLLDCWSSSGIST